MIASGQSAETSTGLDAHYRPKVQLEISRRIDDGWFDEMLRSPPANWPVTDNLPNLHIPPHRNGAVFRRRACGDPCKRLLSHSAESAEKGYQSCHVEPFSHLLHPLSLASGSLGLFQLTPPHIAVVSTAAVSIAVAFTAVASTVVYAREWRSASVLPLSVLLRSVLPPRVLITPPAITALPPRSVVHTATIIMPPTTAVYPRHSVLGGAAVASPRAIHAQEGLE
jgi:hypothetical protein